MGLAGRHSVIVLVRSRRAILVERAFGVFVVKDAVRMHAVGMRGVVLEDHADRVADFGAQNGTENPGGLPLTGRGLSWVNVSSVYSR